MNKINYVNIIGMILNMMMNQYNNGRMNNIRNIGINNNSAFFSNLF